MTQIVLGPGCERLQVPERLRKLIAERYGIEWIKCPSEYGEGTMLIITREGKGKFFHVDLMITEDNLLKEDEEFKERFLDPALNNLDGVFGAATLDVRQ